MQAWRVHNFDDMRLEELPDPAEPLPGWANIRVRVVQPSITECLLYSGLPTYNLDFITRKLAEGPAQMFGHEYCGEVISVGAGVDWLRVGERVAPRSLASCGDCWLCRNCRAGECQKGPITGFDIPGCFAEMATVPADTLVPLPDAVSDAEGATIQALTDAVSGVAAARIKAGDVCVVIGQGAMGLGCMQAARVSGARIAIGVDLRDRALALSRELGSDETIDGRVLDPVEEVLAYTNGRGADVVIDAAGGPPEQGLGGSTTLMQAAAMVRDSGTVVGTALYGEGTVLPYSAFRRRAIRYVFPEVVSRLLLEHVVQLLATGRLRTASTISEQLDGLRSVPRAFELTARKGQDALINPAQVVLT